MTEGYRLLESRVRVHTLEQQAARRRRRQHVRDLLIGALVGLLTWPIFFAWQF